MRFKDWWVILFVGLVVALMAAFMATATTQATDWSTLIERAKPAVVWIVVETSEGTFAGSGAIISPDGYILTAGHVVKGANKITVVVQESKEYSATIVNADYDMDVALLKISASGLTWLALGDSTTLVLEEEIRLLGYPRPELGLGLIMGRGVFLGSRRTTHADLLELDVSPFDHGHSGGPIINRQGKIVGIAIGLSADAEKIFPELTNSPVIIHEHKFAVAVNSAKQIIPSGVLPSGPSPVQPATGPTAHVGPIRVPQDYSTIQAAIQAAGAGSQIQVTRGTYEGDITVTKPLVIGGVEDVVVKGDVTIQGASTVNLANLEVRGRITLFNSTSTSLDNLTVSNKSGQGIHVENSVATIANCTVNGCTGNGVDVSFNSSVTIQNTVITKNKGVGISVSFDSKVRIIKNDIWENRGSGITILGATVEITENSICSNDGYAIESDETSTPLGQRNRGWGNKSGPGTKTVPSAVLPRPVLVPQEISLQEALHLDGAEILISPGEYVIPELKVGNRLYLKGSGSRPMDTVIYVASDKASLTQDLALENLVLAAGQDISMNLGATHIEIGGTAYFEASDVEFHCITLTIKGKAEVQFSRCFLSGPSDAVFLGLQQQAQAKLQDCFVGSSYVGVSMWENTSAKLLNCTIAGNNVGIEVGGKAQVKIEYCWISDNAVGIYQQGDQTAISGKDNTILHNFRGDVTKGFITPPGFIRPGSVLIPMEIEVSPTSYNGHVMEAIAHVATGGIVHVKAGIYQGGILIGRNVTLVGDGPEQTIISGSSSDGITIRDGAEAEIKGIQVSKNSRCGVYVYEQAVAKLEDLNLSENGWYGLAVADTAQVKLQNSVIANNRYVGVYATDQSQISGTGNSFRGSFVDIGGRTSPGVRKPSTQQTEKTKLSVPGDYATIQEAIDAIAPGGVVTVAPGIYTEGLTIWKSVTIEGAGQAITTLRPPPTGRLVVSILAAAKQVRLEGFAIITGADESLLDFGQVEMIHVAILDNKNASDDVFAVNVWGSGQMTLRSSSISIPGLIGLNAHDYARITLQDCVVSEARWEGVRIEDTAQARVIDCTISDNGTGIALYNQASAQIEGSRILHNGLGIHCISPATATITGSANIIPGPDEPDGNKEGALDPPYPGDPWPEGFLKE